MRPSSDEGAQRSRDGWIQRCSRQFMNNPGQPASTALVPSSAQLGLWVFLATVTMLFAAFTSAYLVRSAGSDWGALELPVILWANSAALMVSSLTLETARRKIRRGEIRSSRHWSLGTILLGLAFVAGQLGAWLQLIHQGVYIPTNPYSSFFYVLTGVHGLHLLSGLLVLLFFHFRLRDRAKITSPFQDDICQSKTSSDGAEVEMPQSLRALQ